MAFLDTNPASTGHTLIIPKKHYENIYDVPERELERVIVVAKKLARAYREVLSAEDANILHASGEVAQQSVFHFHIYLVPRYSNDGLNLWYEPKPEVRLNFNELLQKIKHYMQK